jgi:hypothetical protein
LRQLDLLEFFSQEDLHVLLSTCSLSCLEGLRVHLSDYEYDDDNKIPILVFPESLRTLTLDKINCRLDFSKLVNLTSLRLQSCQYATFVAMLPSGQTLCLALGYYDDQSEHYRTLTRGNNVTSLELYPTAFPACSLPQTLQHLRYEDTSEDLSDTEDEDDIPWSLDFGADNLCFTLKSVNLANFERTIPALAPLTPNVDTLVARNEDELAELALDQLSANLLHWSRLRDVTFTDWCPNLGHLPRTLRRFALDNKTSDLTTQFILYLRTMFTHLTELELCFRNESNVQLPLSTLSDWTANQLVNAVFRFRFPKHTFVNKREGYVKKKFLRWFPNIRYRD